MSGSSLWPLFSLQLEEWVCAGSVVLLSQSATHPPKGRAASARIKVESGAAGEARESPPEWEKPRTGRRHDGSAARLVLGVFKSSERSRGGVGGNNGHVRTERDDCLGIKCVTRRRLWPRQFLPARELILRAQDRRQARLIRLRWTLLSAAGAMTSALMTELLGLSS